MTARGPPWGARARRDVRESARCAASDTSVTVPSAAAPLTADPSADDGAQSCAALPFSYAGRQWLAKTGARGVWWWNGTHCIEQQVPFGSSGMPLHHGRRFQCERIRITGDPSTARPPSASSPVGPSISFSLLPAAGRKRLRCRHRHLALEEERQRPEEDQARPVQRPRPPTFSGLAGASSFDASETPAPATTSSHATPPRSRSMRSASSMVLAWHGNCATCESAAKRRHARDRQERGDGLLFLLAPAHSMSLRHHEIDPTRPFLGGLRHCLCSLLEAGGDVAEAAATASCSTTAHLSPRSASS